jgi:hypothetical protein
MSLLCDSYNIIEIIIIVYQSNTMNALRGVFRLPENSAPAFKLGFASWSGYDQILPYDISFVLVQETGPRVFQGKCYAFLKIILIQLAPCMK